MLDYMDRMSDFMLVYRVPFGQVKGLTTDEKNAGLGKVDDAETLPALETRTEQ